jgi:cation:H+ antiporter
MTGELLRFAFGLLVAGGEIFVSGAIRLGRSLRIGSWVTGATLMAFATSAPELSVNLVAAAEGHTELAFGNVIGSNVANVGLILAVAAILRPVPLGSHGLERRLLLLTLLAVLGLALDESVRGACARVGWPEACVLLVGFLYYVTRLLQQGGGEKAAPAPESGWLGAGLLGAGLALLAVGGDVAVEGAIGLSSGLNVPPVIIGLSAVAIGTSLPEFFASLAALRRSEKDLLLGMILGSNLFNLLLVLSATALIRPIPVPSGGVFDLLAMAAFAAFLLPGGGGNRSLARPHGLVMLTAYLAYLGARVILDP